MTIKLNRQKKTTTTTLNPTKQCDKGQRGAEDIHSKN